VLTCMASKPHVDRKTRDQIAAWLRWQIEVKLGITDAAAARLLGCSGAQISRMKTGMRLPGMDVFLLMRKRLHMSLDQMVDMPAPTTRPPGPPGPAPGVRDKLLSRMPANGPRG